MGILLIGIYFSENKNISIYVNIYTISVSGNILSQTFHSEEETGSETSHHMLRVALLVDRRIGIQSQMKFTPALKSLFLSHAAKCPGE